MARVAAVDNRLRPISTGLKRQSARASDRQTGGDPVGREVANADNGESALGELAFIRFQATPKRMRPCATMPLHYPSYGDRLGLLDGFSLHLQICGGITVGCRDTGVTKPLADCEDVDPGSQQMYGGAMTHAVGV